MINPDKKQFRWGPIPGRLISVAHWIAIYHWYPKRLHRFIWPEAYLIFHKEKMLYLNEQAKLDLVGGRVFKEVILTNKAKKFWQIWQKSVSSLLLFYKKISKEHLKPLSDKDLNKFWSQFNDLVLKFWEVAIIPELGAYGGEPILKKAIKKEKLDQVQEIEAFSALAAPVKLSFYQEEERDLRQLARKYKTKSFKEHLNQHQQNYFWLKNSYFRAKVLPPEFFLKRVRQIKKPGRKSVIKEMEKHIKLAKLGKIKVLNKLQYKKEIKKISGGLSHCIWWQDQRKKYIFQYLHYMDLFIAEFARRSKVSPRLFDFAWHTEVCLDPSKNLVNLLERRKKDYFVVHFLKNKKKCVYKKQARKIYHTFWSLEVKGKSNQLTGTVVQPAKNLIPGQVFVIKKAEDIKKFPKGKILVTSMTAPEYICAIRKAKAIITDTGGITSHVAIVSRELKVPCLVGTKIATKLLKNGDKVEVDATRGTVRRL